VPGVSNDDLDFATIVTPDADPAERSGMLDVLEHFSRTRTISMRGHDPPLVSARRHPLSSHTQVAAPRVGAVGRARDVGGAAAGTLSGRAGVRGDLRRRGREWAPVHRFCEREALPCLFPNVQLPIVAEGDFYPLYFSRGVLLEADLIRTELGLSARATGQARARASGLSPGGVTSVNRRAHAHAGTKDSTHAADWIDRPLPAGLPREATCGRRWAQYERAIPSCCGCAAGDLRELPV